MHLQSAANNNQEKSVKHFSQQVLDYLKKKTQMIMFS